MSRPSSKFLAYPSSFEMHPCNHSNGEPALYFCFTQPVKKKDGLTVRNACISVTAKGQVVSFTPCYW